MDSSEPDEEIEGEFRSINRTLIIDQGEVYNQRKLCREALKMTNPHDNVPT
jgi:hypothetical protein